MKSMPRRHLQTICCGLFAILLSGSQTVLGQQGYSNPLRQPAVQPTTRDVSRSPRGEAEEAEVAEAAPAATAASVEPSAPAQAPRSIATAIETSPVRQVAYQEPAVAAPYVAGPGDPHIQGEIVQGEIIQGEIIQGEIMAPHVQHDGLMYSDGIFQKGGKGDCGSCHGGGCFQCCLPCIPLTLDNVEFFGGTQGFSGPANRGGTGSFGFHQGFNIGMPVPCTNECVGVQFGLRATQSNLSGAGFPQDGAGNTLFTDSTRTQTFMTLGLFRRVDWGLQGGVAADYLADNWYADVNISQIRGEASYVFPCTHELGFMFSTASDEDIQVSTFNGGGPLTEIWEGTKQYAFFYRHRPAYAEGAEARIFAGWSGDDDGIIGADIRLPLYDSLALEIGASYLIPEQATNGAPGGAFEEESWNLACSLVWYPGCRSAFGGDYFRPLLNVADNGSFRVGRR